MPVSLHPTRPRPDKRVPWNSTDGFVVGAGLGRRARPGWPCASSASVDLVPARLVGLSPRLRWSRTTGTSMASPKCQPDSAHSLDPPRIWLVPVRDHDTLLDGSWWPSSGDLGVELQALLPVLDRVRGPVTRLLLSAPGWTSRPHQVVLADRTVSVGYLADQSPSMMTVLCADGSRFIMRVNPAGSVPGKPEPGPDDDLHEAFTAWANG